MTGAGRAEANGDMTVGRAGGEPGPVAPIPPPAAPMPPPAAPAAAAAIPASAEVTDLVQWRTPGITLMPTARTLMAFVAESPPPPPPLPEPPAKAATPVPIPLQRLSATGDETGVAISTSLDPAGQVRTSMSVASDGKGGAAPGAVSIEEAKARYVAIDDVAGTGVAIAVDRSSKANITPKGEAGGGADLRHDEHLAVTRSLNLFGGPKPDTTLRADYSVGLAPTRIGPDADGKWLDQAASLGLQTAPARGVTLTVGTDLPLGTSLGGRDDVAVRAAVAVPYVSVGTAQTPTAARYDAQVRGATVGVVALSAGGAVDQDKTNGNVALSGQVLMTLQL